MRRFIASLTGKILSHVVVLALLLPFVSLTMMGKAVAQVQLLPTIAVVEFHVRQMPGSQLGGAAQEAVRDELAKTNQYTVTPPDAVKRVIDSLGLSSPPESTTNLLRVGQELRVQSIATGEVAGVKIDQVNGGKEARVAMQVVIYDVASGLPVNGAVAEGRSTIRQGSVTDDTLISDAIQQGASLLMSQIQQQTLPTATVLNTLTDSAVINQGARSGFQGGQQVVITRGRLQVATARVGQVESDEATIVFERIYLGIAPGDHVRAVANIPTIQEIPFNPNGGVRTVHEKHASNNSGLISLLLIVGVIAAVVGGGAGTNQQAASQVVAEATQYPNSTSPQGYGTKLHWSPEGWAKGFNQRIAWQVWRNDYNLAPVCVTQGANTIVYDVGPTPSLSPDNNYPAWSYFNGMIGGSACNFTTFGNEAPPAGGPPIPNAGQQYIYQVELVYGISSIDLPIVTTSNTGGTGGATGGITGGTTAGTTGTTAGTTGGTTATTGGTTGITGGTTGTTAGTTGTTAGTTGTTASTGTSGQICYFISQRTSAGPATPLQAPVLGQATPTSNGNVYTFSFIGSNRQFPITIDYVVELSDSPGFVPSTAHTYRITLQKIGAGSATSGSQYTTPSVTLFGPAASKPPNPVPPNLINASVIFWRVGARNHYDNPGPVADSLSGERYIFSPPASFTPAHS